MMRGTVLGQVWATRQSPGLGGRKLVLVAARDADGQPTGRVVVAVDTLEAALLLLPLWLELFAEDDPESPELQTVVLVLATFLPGPDVEVEPRARPCVTLWKFSRTSPSDDDIRVTPCFADAPTPCRCGASDAVPGLPGPVSPAFGT